MSTLIEKTGDEIQLLQGKIAAGQQGIWCVIPETGACKKCTSMSGVAYFSKPERPHPNCKCQIKQIEGNTRYEIPRPARPVILLEGMLTGDTSPQYRKVNGYEKITITVQNMNPIRFSDITIEGIVEGVPIGNQGINLYPTASHIFTFFHPKRNISPWTFFMQTNYDDAVLTFRIVGESR